MTTISDQYRAAVAIAAGLALAAVLFAAGWTTQGWRKDGALERERAAYAKTVAGYQAEAASAQAEYRARENQWRAQQDEEIKRARKETDVARADAARADAVAISMRAAAINLARSFPAAGSGAASGSPAASNAGLLLADVLGRCGERLTELAGYADAARIAGNTCQQSYNVIAQ